MSSRHLRGVKPKVNTDQKPLTRVPKAPGYFSSYAQAEWKRVLPVLVARRVICAADLAQVETYCCMAGLVRQIESERQLSGGVIDVKLFGVQNRAAQTARQIAFTLGLDPVNAAILCVVRSVAGRSQRRCHSMTLPSSHTYVWVIIGPVNINGFILVDDGWGPVRLFLGHCLKLFTKAGQQRHRVDRCQRIGIRLEP